MKKENNFVGILMNEYKENKALIWIYVAVCVFASIFAGPLMGKVIGGTTYAAEGTVPVGETLATLATTMVGPTLINLAGSYSSVVGISVEPFAALAFIGLVENINRLCGSPLPIPTTPMGQPVVFLVIALFFAASKIMKSFPGTKVVGDCTLGELEKYLGLVCVLVLGVLNVVGIVNTTSAAVSHAAGIGENFANNLTYAIGIISAVISVIFSLISVVVYLIIKTVSQGLDILAGTLSFIPGVSAVFEVLKSILTVILIIGSLLAPLYPIIALVLNTIVFIICCLLFRRCYSACNYLRKIYIVPFFKQFKGYSESINLISEKFMKKFRKVSTFDRETVDLAIPTFVTKYEGPMKKKFKNLAFGYLVHNTDGIFVVRKKGKKHFEISPEDTKKVYLRRGYRYFELFTLQNIPGNEERKYPKKSFSVVFSKEYYFRFEDIVEVLNCVNYNELKKEQKELLAKNKAERKEMRKQEKLALKEERSKKFNDFVNTKIKKDKN